MSGAQRVVNHYRARQDGKETNLGQSEAHRKSFESRKFGKWLWGKEKNLKLSTKRNLHLMQAL